MDTFKQPISYLELTSYLSYDPESGLFKWLYDSNGHKKEDKVGSIRDGYVIIYVCGKLYPAHRLAWLYMTGKFPDSEIDHIDCNRSNNAWSNLRLATRSENAMNIGVRSDNTTGYKGVSRQAGRDRYQAYIYKNGKRIHLGMYDSAYEAHLAVSAKRKLYHSDFARDEK